jgi:hypothetical protein
MSLSARTTHRESRQQIHPGILFRRITRRGAHIPCTNGAWTAVKTENGYWTFTWSGGAGPFYIWLEGELLAEITGREYEFARDGYDATPPPLEIACELDAENELYPPYATIQWREVDGASYYVVEKYTTRWIAVHSAQDNNMGYHTYKTRVIDDQTETKYRVIALDVRGNAGTAVSYTFQIVRNPAPPEVAYAIDDSNDLEISAA